MAAKKKGGYYKSTEPQARRVVEGIKKRTGKKKAPKKKTLNPTKPTARSPKGVRKTPAQGAKEREALRKKQRERIKAAQKKK